MSDRPPYVVGFKNLGNTCYMNATFHMYSMIQELADYFLDEKFSSSNEPIGLALHKFFSQLAFPQEPAISLASLRTAINYLEPKFNNPDPQDSQEYVKYIYSTIMMKYPDCPLNLTKFDILDINNPENSKTNGILDLYLPPEVNQGDTIPIYHIFDFNFQNSKIVFPPKYLIINMKLDVDHQKKCIVLDFPIDQLDLSKYIKNNDQNCEYELIAAMYHEGLFALDGHDTCYIKVDNKWYYLNDAKAFFGSMMYSVCPFLGKEYHYLLRLKTN